MHTFAVRLMFVVYLFYAVDAVLIGRIRPKEEPGSNVVRTSRFLYPRVHEDPSCKTDIGEPGLCVDIRVCSAARRAVIAGNHPIRCGWVDNFIPLVCCHPDQIQHPKMIFRTHRWRRY